MKKLMVGLFVFFCLSSSAFAGKDCVYKGRTYASGSSTKINDCNWCVCTNGAMLCSRKLCLKKPKKTTKRACVLHPCRVKNGKRICKQSVRLIPHGGKIPSVDECSHCTCNHGVISCMRTAKCLDMASCKLQVKDKRGKVQVITIKHGVKLPTSEDCNRCFCHKGQFICPKNACPPFCKK